MKVKMIRPNVYWAGVNDRTTELFEGLWSIRNGGVSINSYVILDEKKVVIDLSCETCTEPYVHILESLVPLKEIDYVVLNHLEPDHTGALLRLREANPNIIFLGTKKAAEILANFYGIKDNVQVVEDGEELRIGKNTLKFVAVPFVHWPETMVTYLVEEKILFACDAFGSYGALPGVIFDDECPDLPKFESDALRYYANIVSAYSENTKKAIEKLAGTPIEVVAPSHGLIWRKNPERIVELYKKFVAYAEGQREKAVTLVYASMYGNTAFFAEAALQAVAEQGLKVEMFNLQTADIGEILPSVWKNQGLILCAPTYEGSLFPAAVNFLHMMKVKKVHGRTAAYFGSFGWGSMAKKQFETAATELKWDMIENSQFYGKPTQADLDQIYPFAEKFAAAVRAAA